MNPNGSMTMNVFLKPGSYDQSRQVLNMKSMDIATKIIFAFLLNHHKDKIDIKYYEEYHPIVDLILIGKFGMTENTRRNLITDNFTFTHATWCYPHNVLSWFRQENQISLSGVIGVFYPQVWIMLCLFLALFNFQRPLSRLWRVFSKRRDAISNLRTIASKSDVTIKIISGTYILACFLLVEIFKAHLSTKLTVSVDRNINNLDDILKFPKIRINLVHNTIVDKYIKEVRPDVYQAYKQRLEKFPLKKGETYDSLFNQGHVVQIASTTHLEYYCHRGYKAGQRLHYGQDSFLTTYSAYPIATHTSPPIKQLINQRILMYWESGHQIRANSMLNKHACSKYITTDQQLDFTSTTLEDLKIIFFFYTISTIVGPILSVCKFGHCFTRNRELENRIELATYTDRPMRSVV